MLDEGMFIAGKVSDYGGAASNSLTSNRTPLDILLALFCSCWFTARFPNAGNGSAQLRLSWWHLTPPSASIYPSMHACTGLRITPLTHSINCPDHAAPPLYRITQAQTTENETKEGSNSQTIKPKHTPPHKPLKFLPPKHQHRTHLHDRSGRYRCSSEDASALGGVVEDCECGMAGGRENVRSLCDVDSGLARVVGVFVWWRCAVGGFCRCHGFPRERHLVRMRGGSLRSEGVVSGEAAEAEVASGATIGNAGLCEK